jgi:hypothetical protein
VEYKILKNNDEEFFIEIQKNTFSHKILLDFTPDDDFYGLAICCNYHYKGHPVGFLKDNGLVVSTIPGKKMRPGFEIENTIIQAGPTLIENFDHKKNYKDEGFCTHDIISGLHVHIGQKKFGNFIVGLTRKSTLSEIIQKYDDFSVQNAIKLPGGKQAGFYFRSSHQIIQEGLIPMPVALIFESGRKKGSNLLG